MGAVRLLNKRFGVAGDLFNHFDGGVDLMDDLDDHYTAHQHKKERKDLIIRLQRLARAHLVRVTILGGDVHLAAYGRFYSRPDLELPPENDHRFMSNVISSAITNHPPPAAVANLLAARNKIHHLDRETDETLLNLFDVDPGRKPLDGANGKTKISGNNGKEVQSKTASKIHCTMPSPNYAILALSQPTSGASNGQANGTSNGISNGHPPTPTHTNGTSNGTSNGHALPPTHPNNTHDQETLRHHDLSRKPGNPRDTQHPDEDNCGVHHPAAEGHDPSGLGGQWGLDVTYRVEIDRHDRDGRTQGYGVTVPGLVLRSGERKEEGVDERVRDEVRDVAERAGRHV